MFRRRPHHRSVSDSRQRISWAFLITLALATFIVLGNTVQDYLEVEMIQDRDISFFRMLLWPSIWWYGWVLIVPFAFEYAWRNRLSSPDRWRKVGRLVVGGVLTFLAHLVLELAVMSLPYYEGTHASFNEMLEFHLLGGMYLNVFIYLVIVATAHVSRAYSEANERALKAARLEAELAEARLDVLKTQLHPHFLFNALNGVSALIHSDADTAEHMLTRLSGLLRKALDRSSVDKTSLADEMTFLREYLAMERLRFGDKLQVEVDVPVELEEIRIPVFLFQPLVENAIKHGFERGSRAGTIKITARRMDGVLVLTVCDNGVGWQIDADVATSGVGLSNLQSRLVRLYGDSHRIVFSEADGGGLCIRIELPVHT